MSGEKKKRTLLKDALILFAITLIAALALGAVYEITKTPIAQAKEQAKTDAAKAVFPEMVSMNNLAAGPEAESRTQAAVIDGKSEFEGVSVTEINFAYDADQNCIGCILTMTSTKGYGGAITMTMGVSKDGTLKGIEFLSISETAGLGMKAKEDGFKSQFSNIETDSFSLAKKGICGTTPVDAISSATITTAAVTRMVNAGLKCAEYQLESIGCRKEGN